MNTFSYQSEITDSDFFGTDLHKLQQKLLKYIHLSPGIRYRELLRLTDSSHGVLSYHLGELEFAKRISVDRKKNVTRYYPIHITAEVSKIIGCIRNSVSRTIILNLMNNDGCTLSELTIATNRSASTISWHLRRLSEAGVLKKSCGSISDERHYPTKYYYIAIKSLMTEILSKYVESPMDKLVSDYSDLMDELA